MLEFLVLGQIPGTHITLNFQSVLALISLCIGLVLGRHIVKNSRRIESLDIKDIVL